jgi:hypothetical protein
MSSSPQIEFPENKQGCALTPRFKPIRAISA